MERGVSGREEERKRGRGGRVGVDGGGRRGARANPGNQIVILYMYTLSNKDKRYNSKKEIKRMDNTENELERKVLRIGILNIGTLRGKEEEIVMMMQERKINIMGISETRRKTSGRTVLHDPYICMASGDPTGKYGVALIVTPEVANRMEHFKPINNGMAHMTVNFGREKAVFMIMYAPQQGKTDKEKEEFFGNVQTEIDTIKSNKEFIAIGDLNGHVGTTRPGYEQAIEHQGIGETNAEGKRILDVCVRSNLAVMNTYYQHKEAHKWTRYGCNEIKGHMTSSHISTCSYLQIKTG